MEEKGQVYPGPSENGIQIISNMNAFIQLEYMQNLSS